MGLHVTRMAARPEPAPAVLETFTDVLLYLSPMCSLQVRRILRHT